MSVRRTYKPARVECPMTMCDWIATTGKPVGRQEWADTHLDLTLELADHLRRCHDANPDYTENSPPLVSRISVSS